MSSSLPKSSLFQRLSSGPKRSKHSMAEDSIGIEVYITSTQHLLAYEEISELVITITVVKIATTEVSRSRTHNTFATDLVCQSQKPPRY
jgi:hypothetical protein